MKGRITTKIIKSECRRDESVLRRLHVRVGVEILWGVKLKAEQTHRDWRKETTEPQTTNSGRSGTKVTFENVFCLPHGQSQDSRLCKHIWQFQSSECLAKHHCSPYLFIYLSRYFFFLFLLKEKKGIFIFWCYPNETLSPFPWRQSQNCQVPSLSKQQKKKKKVLSGKGWWWGLGLLFNCQLGRWNFHCNSFFMNSAGLQALVFFFLFITTPTLAASKNASVTIIE